jgi:ABC-2 type transport system permease protein
MKPPEPAASPAASSDAVTAFVSQALAVTGAELRKLRRDPAEIATRSVQPLLWLLVFGQVFTRARAIPTGSVRYLDFLAPGVLAQSVLFSAIFYGIGIIREKDLGVLHKLLVTPAYRSALVLGKALAAAARGLVQAVVVYIAALVMGVQLKPSPLAIAAVMLAVMLGSAVFATFSLVIACIVKTHDRFMGMGQVITMPLFFASNAIYPIELMPQWLQAVARLNPLSYLVDAIRSMMIEGGPSVFGYGVDVLVEAGILAGLVALAAKLYPTVVR